MRRRWGIGLVGLAMALTAVAGCSSDGDDAPSSAPSETAQAAPTYDPKAPPATAVMALVPDDAQTVSLTDWTRLKNQLGFPLVTGTSSPADQAAFWKAAEDKAPLLTLGRLRPVDRQLRSTYGFGADDVAWEAEFRGKSGEGWVVRFSDEVAMADVAKAVRAGVGPLKGAQVDQADKLVSKGTTDEGEPNLASVDGITDLLGPQPATLYLHRGCIPGDIGGADLEPLQAYAVDFGTRLMTARLGLDRTDLFERMRLGEKNPQFRRLFKHGASDPTHGRIGFQMTDPPAAANMILRDRAPFAVCLPG